MIAIVLTDRNTSYTTPVFAIKAKGWGSEVIVLDESRTHVKKVEMWEPRRQVFIVEWKEFPCKRKGWAGYARIINDKHLMRALCAGESVPIGEDERFAEFASEITLPDLFEVKSDADIESLMGVAFDFHDSEIVAINRKDDTVEIVFDTTWGCYITVRFGSVTQENGIEEIGLILNSTLTFQDGKLFWEVTDGASGSVGEVDWEKPFSGASITCGKMNWLIEIDWSEDDSEED